MRIRDLQTLDWPAVHEIFSAVVDEGRTYSIPAGLTVDESPQWWIKPPPGRTVVAVAGGEVLGTAAMGPNRPGRGSHIATAGFMVAPAAAGRGVGRSLGEHVVQWARDEGYRGIQFNAVVETNTAAVRLWRSLGFDILATVPGAFDHPDHGFVGLHVMFLDLVDPL